jgi:hypothetical protein
VSATQNFGDIFGFGNAMAFPLRQRISISLFPKRSPCPKLHGTGRANWSASTSEPSRFHLNNGFFDSIDTLVAHVQLQLIIEVMVRIHDIFMPLASGYVEDLR